MTKLNSDEPVQLLHKVSDARQIFMPGDDVPDEWIIPERCMDPDAVAEAAAEAQAGAGAGEGDGDGDDDDLDEGDDEEPATEGGGPDEPQPDGAFLELDIDVASATVQGVIDAVMAVRADLRDEAARWVLSEESRRPAPRSGLLTAMRKLLPS
mgnify:FL=1